MKLHILVQVPTQQVISLTKIYSDWHFESIIPEKDISDVLPDRFSDAHSAWLKKQASIAQAITVAKQIGAPVTSLPQLTAFNANAVIQESLLHRHLPTVSSLLNTSISSATKHDIN